jgi:tetratricopeptide (TPR) repeat protein
MRLGPIKDQSASIVLAPEESDPHLNRGTAEEALQDWSAAADDYLWILERDPQDASALYNLANVRGSQGDWPEARELYGQAASARPGFAMARSSEALAAWQAGRSRLGGGGIAQTDSSLSLVRRRSGGPQRPALARRIQW